VFVADLSRSRRAEAPRGTAATPRPGAAARVLSAIWNRFAGILKGIQDLVWFSVRAVVACFRPPFYLRDLYEQTYFAGVGSLPVVLISTFFAGQALALQFARNLRETGSETLLGTLMNIAVVRALGPDLVGMVVAARLAAGYTAEIGSMKSTDQIDALVAFGTDPMNKLVVPRLIGLVLMLPLLTFVGDAVAFLGGALMARYVAHVSLSLYWTQIFKGMDHGTLLIGTLKPLTFAFIIVFVSCWKGFQSAGGTRGVGHATTESVVIASVLILIFDFILTRVIFALLGW
jgi:phospholipid/cholesterol/gamma-HCH transport system permease protein